jgi:hypothetical protein
MRAFDWSCSPMRRDSSSASIASAQCPERRSASPMLARHSDSSWRACIARTASSWAWNSVID